MSKQHRIEAALIILVSSLVFFDLPTLAKGALTALNLGLLTHLIYTSRKQA